MKNNVDIIEFSQLKHKVAAVWTRVSSKKQKENNCSLETQKRCCEEYAQLNGIKIKKYYGGTFESAKTEGVMYKKMIAEIAKDREINIILVHSFDRFSRAGVEAIMTKTYLHTQGIYVVSATQKTDPDTAAGEFAENMFFIFNQFENKLRRDKSITGMRNCLKKGQWYSKPPLGYTKEKVGKEHVLKVNADGELLRKAFKWKAEGLSDKVVIERLAALGLHIDHRHFNKIIHNRFYCGYIRHKLLGSEEIRGTQEVLIDEATWNKINNVSKVGCEHKKVTENLPLKHHIICSDCGTYFTGYTVKKKGIDYYKCNKIGCKSNHNADRLHKQYEDLLNTYKIPTEFMPIFSKVLHKVFSVYTNEENNIKSALLKRHTELIKKKDEVQIKYGLGEINEEVYVKTNSHLMQELFNVESKLENVSKNLSNLEAYIDVAMVMSCRLGVLWRNGDFENKQMLQKLIFPNGVLYDKNLGTYRTDNENEVFALFRRLSADYMNYKTKTKTEFLQSSPLVALRGIEPLF